jgi:dATP pyrophosphohydrolase
MARAPFNVLVIPCRRVGDGFLYALLRRADAGFWQGIAGGGEDGETPLEAARREAREEAGIDPAAEFIPLQTVMPVPVTEFRDSARWGEDLYVIPQYCFGVRVGQGDLRLSREHTAFGWFPCDEARALVRFDGDRIALWELDRRLRGLGPRG